MSELKFNDKGNAYAKNRPSYPREFINFLYNDVGLNADSIIADIGSGTGKLTQLLLERGSRVFAIEPNSDMRTIAESCLGDHDNFISVNSTAENTSLDDNCVDFITVATAFHWFSRQAFKKECKRILKKDGKIIIVYNSRNEESDFVKRLYEVNRRYCPEFEGFTGSGVLLRPENANYYNDFFTGDYVVKIIDNNLTYDEQGFIGRSLSSSYALKENATNYSAYIQELRLLFQQNSTNNIMIMPNVTHSYIGTV